jgi:hypothetical protein
VTAGALDFDVTVVLTAVANAVTEAWRRRFDDWLKVVAFSRHSAHQLNDKGNEAGALTTLGNALAEVRRIEEAIARHEQDIAICRETGDWYGEGQTLDNLGNAYQEMGESGRAAAC